MIDNLCSPALLYVGFSLVHILIDMLKQLYNTAFLKFLVMTIFTIILNLLCEQGLGIISWFMVFIPFIFMTVITTLLLFIFGLDPKNGKFNYSVNEPNQQNNTLKRITPEQSPIFVNRATNREQNNSSLQKWNLEIIQN